MKPEGKKYQALVGGKALIIETGKLASQAGGAATVRLGDSVIFCAATMSPEARKGIDFFPLTVNYEARMYAGGTIPGSFFRRESRPGENATLIARLTDRPIRPLFPKDLKNAVQIMAYAFSADKINPLDTLVVNSTSVALTISDIPWEGPIGAVRVGRIDGEFVTNPSFEEIEKSDLDLVIAASRDAVLMVESGSKEVSEETIVEAINYGHQAIQPIIDVQEKMAEEIGKEKRGKRPDGRGFRDVREIWCDVDTVPRAHGSGIFTRGNTQVMTFATLGTPRDAQMIDNLRPEESKRYMHHYNFPPFCVGEVRFLRGAGRREIGHGALAERALRPVIPNEKEFPYTIRLVSEVLASNGSSSMASVCGSTLSLMDTGVPIKAPVAGVAMGLVKEGENYAILTDIQGLEDHLGDMDFKVAGTKNGITALQMDIKLKGLSSEVMSKALAQAKEAREYIMGKMMEVIDTPRPELKNHVPRMVAVQIPVDKIGAVIGPGGETIRSIQEETGAKIDIDDDGTVFIATADGESSRRARERVEMLTATPEVGRIYTGKVVGVKNFGAFVEILPGADGLVHISQLDSSRVKEVGDVVSYGDEITVMVTDISRDGKIRLSRRAVLEGWTLEEAQGNDRKR
ncbi:MAG: polyribonucleotide nucleotidyltransferase [Anaerolineaceae bacterium 4572_5.2]|nr:MAG: polyribonucleotide nucleotidyltransferase [Anaerolineaceae bacterium 4572_5.2]